MPEGLLTTSDPIVLANIFIEAPDRQLSLVFSEPCSRAWEVGQDKEPSESDHYRDNPFNDEEPSPRPRLTLAANFSALGNTSSCKAWLRSQRPAIHKLERKNQQESCKTGAESTHLRPFAPSKPLVIPADMRPEKAPESKDPEYRIAVLNPSSFRVYQDDKKNRQPGK